MPTVTTAAFRVALAEFARDEGIDATHRVVLVLALALALDGAGWHGGHELVVPEGLHLVPLPPASPELQPAERLWPLVDEVVANRTFANLDALETVLVERCRRLRADRRRIRGQTRYHWWPREGRPRRKQP